MAFASVLLKLAPTLFDIIDKVIPTEEGRAAARLKVMELEQKGQLAQIEVNAKEAGNSSLFVAGWRPFVGWICGLSFAWVFLLQPVLLFVLAAFGLPTFAIPFVDMDNMLVVLFGLLGLGGLRTYEKKSGISREVDPLASALNTAIQSEDGVDRKAKR